ncbi:hypothetical protein A7D21_32880 [Pseudomonas sp. AP19]|nr:hypothetical protein A7D21_32880 [Pseudomonas sp. AP19]
MILYLFANRALEGATNVAVLSPNESPGTQHPTGGISDLPGILSTATSWMACTELWPDRLDSDAATAEIHIAVHADHSLSVINDLEGSMREVGIFRGTLFCERPGPLTWLRPHSACSVDYLGLRWVVPRERLDDEVQRIVLGVSELAGKPGTRVPTD